MGALQIEDDGIRVTGKAEFENPVHFQQLSTKDGVPLFIESDHGLYLHARNSSGMVKHSFFELIKSKRIVDH